MKGLPRTGKGKSNRTDLAMGDAVAQHPPLIHFHFIPEYPVHSHECWGCYICLHRTDLFVFSCCCIAALASLQIQSPADITLHLSHQWTSSEETVLYLSFIILFCTKGNWAPATHWAPRQGKLQWVVQLITSHKIQMCKGSPSTSTAHPFLSHFRLYMIPDKTGFWM